MVTLIPAVAVALAILLLAAIISILIQFEGGINPKDDNKRRIVFWGKIPKRANVMYGTFNRMFIVNSSYFVYIVPIIIDIIIVTS